MNRAIVSLFALATCATEVACSSSGDTSGPTIRTVGVTQSPPQDPNLPSPQSTLPPADPNLPPPDPNLPPRDTRFGGTPIGGSAPPTFIPNQETCTALCSSLADTQC